MAELSRFETYLLINQEKPLCLAGLDLSEADLRHANLSEAKLYETNLRNANLKYANLSKETISLKEPHTYFSLQRPLPRLV